MILWIICPLALAVLLPQATAIPEDSRCAWKQNLTADPRSADWFKELDELESCLYFYLLDKEYEKTNKFRSLIATAPPEQPLRVEIENVVVHHVELKPQSTYQFRIIGDIYLNWLDTRLEWDAREWNLEQFTLHNGHDIWSPKMTDHGICGGDSGSCLTTLSDVDLMSDGRVYARLHFVYDSLCAVDYTRYPEEENNCCIFFTSFDSGADIALDMQAKEKASVEKTVGVAKEHKRDRTIDEIYELEGDHSAWTVNERSAQVSPISPFSSLQVLRVCVHAEKRMGTLKLALHLPVTICTLIMLVSPLFGDLRMQAWVKLICLALQTMCFLFLCSIAPQNGFASTKPKIYTFYESVFILTLLSVIVTVAAMALCRVKRSVPPSHRIYLLAKLVNRLICCVEPESNAAYQRYIEESDSRPAPTTSEADYTQDWRHIYVAANNLVSGLFFTIFLFVSIYELL